MEIKEAKYSPIGIVTIYDCKSHEKIFETHNMIVGTGRELIIKAIFGNSSLSSSNFKMFYDSNNRLTTDSLKYDNLIENDVEGKITSLAYFNIDGESDGKLGTWTEPSYSEFIDFSGPTTDNNKYYINIDGKVELSSAFTVYGIGLIYYNPNTKTNTLFSRAYIDPVYLRNGRTYLVNYKIYF